MTRGGDGPSPFGMEMRAARERMRQAAGFEMGTSCPHPGAATARRHSCDMQVIG